MCVSGAWSLSDFCINFLLHTQVPLFIYASFFLCVDEDAGHSCSLTVLHSNVGIATDLCFAPSNNKLLVSVGQDSKIRFQDVHQRKLVV